jgi:pSer/pThr/pTyr-binding forkhead associated (FHA) protein
MWKLTIEDDEGKRTSLPLAHDEYGIGRAEANAIRLTDRNVSRKHAVLSRNAQGWVVKDLQSYNGTYVNGLRVAGDQHVAHGDIVQLGDYRLELVDESAAATDATEQPGPLPVHQRPDRLVVVVGPTPGAEYPLDRGHFTVGRAEDANVSINHSSVSRFHAEIFSLGSGRYEIIDKGSANGIRINGYEVKRGLLEPGDALELGDVRLRFVGRGKIFRAGADQSQQLAAVASFESVAPSVRAPALQSPRPQGTGIGKYIGIGALLGLIGIAILLLAMRGRGETDNGGTDTPAPETTKLEDKGVDVLRDAKALYASGQLEQAHARLGNVPDDSAAREDPAFAEIAGAWADDVFKRVDALGETSDANADEKIALLHKIVSANTTVDSERRIKAGELLDKIHEETGKAIPSFPSPRHSPVRTGPRPTGGSTGAAAGTSTTQSNDSVYDEVEDTGKPAATDYAAQKAMLEPRVWSGKASRKEVLMLRAVCVHLKDNVCRDKASQILASMPKEE